MKQIKITFMDCFSKCLVYRYAPLSDTVFKSMQNGIGQTVPVFENGINYLLEVVKVEQV
jgi:hypothetical protein